MQLPCNSGATLSEPAFRSYTTIPRFYRAAAVRSLSLSLNVLSAGVARRAPPRKYRATPVQLACNSAAAPVQLPCNSGATPSVPVFLYYVNASSEITPRWATIYQVCIHMSSLACFACSLFFSRRCGSKPQRELKLARLIGLVGRARAARTAWFYCGVILR